MNLFIIYAHQYENRPSTNLLAVEEPTYPYIRRKLNCFGKANTLKIDLSNSQVCVILERASNPDQECGSLPPGVLYDVYFNNNDAWRTQQRDFHFNTTLSYCFPCYYNASLTATQKNCFFARQTQFANVYLRTEIFESEVMIGHVILQKVNMSACYNTTSSFVRVNTTNSQLKMVALEDCKFVFGACSCTSIDKRDYDNNKQLILTRNYPITAEYWRKILFNPQEENGERYYVVDFEQQNDIATMPIFESLLVFNYQCRSFSHKISQSLRINSFSSLNQYSITNTPPTITIEPTYINFRTINVFPHVKNYKFDTFKVRIVIKNETLGTVITSITFQMPNFNFENQYIYCDNVIDISTKSEKVDGLENQCSFIFKQLMSRLDSFSAILFFGFEDINNNREFTFVTQQVTQFTTGCWTTVALKDNSGVLEATVTEIAPECQYKDAFKAIIKIEQQNETTKEYSEITSIQLQYSLDITSFRFTNCNQECLEKILYNKVLLSAQGVRDTSNYIEIWVEPTQTKRNMGNIVPTIIAFSVVVIVQLIAIITYDIVSKMVAEGRCRSKKSMEVKLADFDEI